ncbi:MAG: S8 family peptidase [Bacteroidota bacterium]
MKKINLMKKILPLFVISILLLTASCNTDNDGNVDDLQSVQEGTSIAKYSSIPIEGQYIIILNNKYAGKSTMIKGLEYKDKLSMLKSELPATFSKVSLSKDDIVKTFGHAFNGFAAKLSEDQIAVLKNDDRIKYIEQDQIISLSPITAYKKPVPTPPAAETPWGITRVGGVINFSASATAWIIDSGIDLDHPDLNVDAARSACFLDRGDANDQNGHGTHVAGTVAALDNEIGVVGVAPGATLVAVRVLDRRGSGSISGVIAGVDYVAANGVNGDVANMSLGGGVSTTLDDAVIAAAATGVKFALAAGNESDDANNHSPARANGPNIYTVSAMDINDNFAYFSNYGNPPIEFCAPGVNIYSTWKDGGYNTISGTSMAAPHVCGLLLGNISTDGEVNGDPDGDADPIAHN